MNKKNIPIRVLMGFLVYCLCGYQYSQAGVPLGPSLVEVEGNQLFIQKRLPTGELDSRRPYSIKGVVWNPATRAPVDGPNPTNPLDTVSYGFFFDFPGRNPQGHVVFKFWSRTEPANHYLTDIPLIKAMNVNTIRTFGDFGEDPGRTIDILDEFYENGIMVVMTVAGAKSDLDINDHLTIVNQMKDHPAILMWALGNEWNLNRYFGFSSLAEAKNATQQAALDIKALDSNHPVSSSLGDRFTEIVSIVSDVTNVDVWGLNIYRGASFGTLFQDWAGFTGLPFYFSEFGTDSFATTSYTVNNGRADDVVGAEDEIAQAVHVTGLWGEIETHLATGQNTEPSIGGFVFNFHDALYKVGNFHVGLGGLVDYDGPDDIKGTPDDDTSYDEYNTEGFINGGHPDNIANQEYFGVVNADRIPKEVFFRMANAFGYVLHLGIDGTGTDIFPQETANEPYLTGAASALMVFRYLKDGYSGTQETIYNTYHSGPAGNELTGPEMEDAVNGELSSPYHFQAFGDTDQMAAIQRFAHWMDYVPPGGTNTPALIPTGGGLNWKVVRGIVTDVKPLDPANVFFIPDFEFQGIWLNDPRVVAGLGFDIFQTAAQFQVEYTAINDLYWSVNEPPLGAGFHKAEFARNLKQAKGRFAKAIPNQNLKGWINAGSANPKVRHLLSTLRKSLPSPLRGDPVFMDLYDQSSCVTPFHVLNEDKNTSYELFALGSNCHNNRPRRRANRKGARYHIILQIDSKDGAFSQATWDKEGGRYPLLSEKEAIQIARSRWYKTHVRSYPFPLAGRGQGRNMGPKKKKVDLIWSQTFGTSQFHPTYRVEFLNDVFLVYPNGHVE